MTGWNLPPGCNVSDIPGNRPIDVFIDRFIDKYCSNCESNKTCNLDACDCPYNVIEKAEEAYYNREYD